MELEQLHHAYRHGDLQLQGATTLPMNILAELPELQMLNVACNQKIPGDGCWKTGMTPSTVER